MVMSKERVGNARDLQRPQIVTNRAMLAKSASIIQLMKCKPVLFNTDMVRAILDDRKTVTRRIVKPQPENVYVSGKQRDVVNPDEITFRIMEHGGKDRFMSPPYHPGDILYVRETFGNWCCEYHESNAAYYQYRADYPDGARTYMYDEENECDLPKWHPSIHMPIEAARIWLRVTDIRVERLQDITEEQAIKEGCCTFQDKIGNGKFNDVIEFDLTAREAFAELWNSTLKKDSNCTWAHNPWVWVIEFERCEKPKSD